MSALTWVAAAGMLSFGFCKFLNTRWQSFYKSDKIISAKQNSKSIAFNKQYAGSIAEQSSESTV